MHQRLFGLKVFTVLSGPSQIKVCCPCSSILPVESLILPRLHRTADLVGVLLLINTEPQDCEMWDYLTLTASYIRSLAATPRDKRMLSDILPSPLVGRIHVFLFVANQYVRNVSSISISAISPLMPPKAEGFSSRGNVIIIWNIHTPKLFGLIFRTKSKTTCCYCMLLLNTYRKVSSPVGNLR